MDTHDLASVAPGMYGENWRKFIHTRHIVIKETKAFEQRYTDGRWYTFKGQQESEEAGSSWNTGEIDVVDTVVRGLLAPPGIQKGGYLCNHWLQGAEKTAKRESKRRTTAGKSERTSSDSSER